jgi:hypothetical protein
MSKLQRHFVPGFSAGEEGNGFRSQIVEVRRVDHAAETSESSGRIGISPFLKLA